MIVVRRKIGSIALDVTIEERHNDTLQITQFPVLSGSVITDHSYKLPQTLSIRAGQGTGSDPKAEDPNITNVVFAKTPDSPYPWQSANHEELGVVQVDGGDRNRPTRTYKQLLSLQASREPFTVITGKRIYKNMLIRNLSVVTDQDTENVLVVSADLQEIIIVNSQFYGDVKDFVKSDTDRVYNGVKATQNIGRSGIANSLVNTIRSDEIDLSDGSVVEEISKSQTRDEIDNFLNSLGPELTSQEQNTQSSISMPNGFILDQLYPNDQQIYTYIGSLNNQLTSTGQSVTQG